MKLEENGSKIKALKALAKMMVKLDLDRVSAPKKGAVDEESVEVEESEEDPFAEPSEDEESELVVDAEEVEGDEKASAPSAKSAFEKMLAGRAKKI